MKRKTIFFFMAFFTMTMYSQIPQLDSIGSEKLLRRAFEYRNGINRSVNLGKAAIIYKHLCHRGNIEAMVPFGEMKLHGEGVEKTCKELLPCLTEQPNVATRWQCATWQTCTDRV